MHWIQIVEIWQELDVDRSRWHMRPETEADSVKAAPLLSMLMMCMLSLIHI